MGRRKPQTIIVSTDHEAPPLDRRAWAGLLVQAILEMESRTPTLPGPGDAGPLDPIPPPPSRTALEPG